MSAISPILSYEDALAAVDFLQKAFGFEEKMLDTNDDGEIVHCELAYGDDVVMIARADDPGFRHGQGSLYLVADDPDSLFDRAVSAGAKQVYAPRDTSYGSREFAVADPEGNTWYVGTYHP